MADAAPRGDCPHEAARLLPWFVNGTLPDAEARQVAGHLERCALCRADAAVLGRVRTLLRAPAAVEHAPHAGLRRLLARIDGGNPRRAPAPRPAVATSGPAGARPLRWLIAALLLQSAALVALGAAMWFGRPAADAPPAPYRTLAAVEHPQAAVRAVFASTATLGELQELLRASGLVVLAGPTDAGVYTLALRPAGATDAGDALARLRADPRVRFAEPVVSDLVPR